MAMCLRVPRFTLLSPALDIGDHRYVAVVEVSTGYRFVSRYSLRYFSYRDQMPATLLYCLVTNAAQCTLTKA